MSPSTTKDSSKVVQLTSKPSKLQLVIQDKNWYPSAKKGTVSGLTQFDPSGSCMEGTDVPPCESKVIVTNPAVLCHLANKTAS